MKHMDDVEELPEDRSMIVVSDLHLGLKERDKVPEVFLLFAEFLKKVCSGKPSDNPDVTVDGKTRKLFPPSKIILLGDIIDLWSPRSNSRSSVLIDSYPVIQALFSLPADIVYVAGNHDDEISEIEGSFPRSGPEKLKVIKRHYPEGVMDTDGREKHHGILAGDHSYFFMHGQQFDLMFNVAGLLQNYPGWVARNYSLFKENPRIKWIFRLIFIICAGYGIIAQGILKISTFLDGFIYFLLGMTLVIFLFSMEPSTFRNFWDSISLRKKTKTETIETIIEAGFWKKEAGKDILADTVIFGHTHIADDSKGRYLQEYGKRFINSGSWGDEPIETSDGRRVSEKNTFVYIDAEGPVLFHWPDKGTVPEQIETTLTGDAVREGPKISNFRYMVRQNLIMRG